VATDSRVGPALGRQLRRIRRRKGWSQQRLSEELKALGHVLHPTAVLKVEKGTRAVTVEELLGLAAALNVPPVLLLLPLGEEDVVEITTNSRIHPGLALEWVCGEEALVSSRRFVIERGEWLKGSEPLRLYRALRHVEEGLRGAETAIRRAEYAGDADSLRDARRAHTDALEALHGHVRAMQTAGVRPPGQTPEMLAAMEAVGLDVSGFPVFEAPEQEGG
jgi:transcriptional regulator with XRE-family HTH domain